MIHSNTSLKPFSLIISTVNQQVNSTKTEPVQINYDQMKGPFQYAPFTIDHPGQPEDDFSVKDPTVKTLDRSRLCLSPFNVNHEISNERISFIQEPSNFQLLAFTQKSQETTKGFQNQKKLKPRFAELLKAKININEKVRKYSYIFDLGQSDSIPSCNKCVEFQLSCCPIQNYINIGVSFIY